MLVKTEAWILIFPGTDFYFPSTFLGSVLYSYDVCSTLVRQNLSRESIPIG